MTKLPPSRTRTLSMILPPFDRPTGEFPRNLNQRDARIPRPFAYDRQARLLAHWVRDENCPDGRHLWDAAVAEGVARYDEDDGEHLPFRLQLTCVRCGTIYRLAGVTDESNSCSISSVSPTPLQAGCLRAQQIEDGGRFGLSGWAVHNQDGVIVGGMSSGVTVRGRRYVTGRLQGQPPVEAPTPMACLRKLAKLAVRAAG